MLSLETALISNLFRIKETDASKLQDEYAKLVEGLQENEGLTPEDDVTGTPGTQDSASIWHGEYILHSITRGLLVSLRSA